VDALIPISNENIFKMGNSEMTLDEAFGLGDQVLMQGVRGISEIILKPGFINVDFADVRMVLENAGTAVMGIGTVQEIIEPRRQHNRRFLRPIGV